jgi:hypothetical protein
MSDAVIAHESGNLGGERLHVGRLVIVFEGDLFGR